MRKALACSLLLLSAFVAYAQSPQKTGILREPVQISLLLNGKQVGTKTAAAGEKVQIVSETAGKVQIAISGGQAWVTPDKVDVQSTPAAPVVAAATPKPLVVTKSVQPTAAPEATLTNYSVEELALRKRVTEGPHPLVAWINSKACSYPRHRCLVVKDFWIAKTLGDRKDSRWVILANMWPKEDADTSRDEGNDFFDKPDGLQDMSYLDGSGSVYGGCVYIQKIPTSIEDLVDVYVYTQPDSRDIPDIERRAKLGAGVFIAEAWGSEAAAKFAKQVHMPIPTTDTNGSGFGFAKKGNIVAFRIDEAKSNSELTSAGVKPGSGKPLAHKPTKDFVKEFIRQVDDISLKKRGK